MLFNNAFSKRFGGKVNIDISLLEIRDNPDEQWTMRALAGHSVGMPAEDGFLAARELHEAVCWAVDGRPEGKVRLASILGNRCDDYQRALYYSVAGRGPLDMISDLGQLVKIMEARCEAAFEAVISGYGLIVAPSPYRFFDGPDGPLGRFEDDFDFSDAWVGIAHPT